MRADRDTWEHYLQPNNQGYTPLHWAARDGGFDGVIEAFRVAGKKLSRDYFLIEANNGETPLHQAALGLGQGLQRLISILEAAGEPLSLPHFLIENDAGETVLYHAAVRGSLTLIEKALQASGEKLSLEHFLRKTADGETLLHAAARNGHLNQAMEVFAHAGGKFSLEHFLIENDEGQTPLDMARKHGHLRQIFIASYWQNRVGEMTHLWTEVKTGGWRVNFEKIQAEAIQLSVQGVPKIDTESFHLATRAAMPFFVGDPQTTERLP